MLDGDNNEISKITAPAITEAILAFREKRVIIKPGGGGQYGIIELPNDDQEIIIVSQGPTLPVEVPKTSESPAYGKQPLEEIEREHKIRVLEASGWRIEGKGGAAQILGLNPGTLRSRMKKLGIKSPVTK